MSQLEILKKVLKWYMEMYGCSPTKNTYDDFIEYSCNGYVISREEVVAISQAKKILELDWFEL